MSRLKHDLGREVRPCEYFHSITGVGAGGVIAVLLGVLGLSVEKATESFGQICERVFPGTECTEAERSSKLADAMNHILDGLHIPDGTRLRGDLDINAGCHVSVCYSSAATNSCMVFRNYESRHSFYNPTITEAVRVSWASPGLFSPMLIGNAPLQEELTSAVNGFNNPTREAIREAREVFGKGRTISSILSLGGGKNGAVPATSMAAPIRVAQETEITAEDMQRRFGTLGIYFRLSVEYGIEFERNRLESHFASITAHTRGYLSGDLISRTLDRYLKTSARITTITLDGLHHARGRSSKSSHGLPPLSACFGTRHGALDQITAAMGKRASGSPAIGVITGMSGTGKTQIALKYAYNSSNEYDHIIFIDASSSESIEKSLITRIRSIDRKIHPNNVEDALESLVNPEGDLSRNWLIVMDNADDKKVELRNYIPCCHHGSILITSRNASLGDLFPDGHIALDVMSREEAIEALLFAALGPKESPSDDPLDRRPTRPTRTQQDYECAGNIVEELGRLPLAVIQAACYIKKQKCLHEYLNLLKTSRSKILQWPASIQRDRLQYAHSVYAAFDTTLSALSPRALQLLGIISFVHFADFPRALFALASSYNFNHQPYDLLDRPPEYRQSIELLQKILCPNGDWGQTEFDGLLEELQSYSLVTLVPIFTMVILRFHPLLHGWANDRLSPSERTLFQLAAIRLLVCGTHWDDGYLRLYLTSHVNLLSLASADLHVNDKAAFAHVLRGNGQKQALFDVWNAIHNEVGAAHGLNHLRTNRAALYLADAYGQQGNRVQMELMEREVVKWCKDYLGENHLDTTLTMANLARTLRWGVPPRYEEAVELELQVLHIRRELLGPKHREIVGALADLAQTYKRQTRFQEAQLLLVEASDMIIALVSEKHVASIRIMEQRVDCHLQSGDIAEGIRLKQEVMDLWRAVRGEQHASTPAAMASLAETYSEQGQYQEAEEMWCKVVKGRRYTLGDQHIDTLNALFGLGESMRDQGRFSEAETVFAEVLSGRQSVLGDTHNDTLEGLWWLVTSVYCQGRYTEACTLMKDIAAKETITLGHMDDGTLDAISTFGRLLYDQGEFGNAEALLKDAVDGWRSKQGDIDESKLDALYDLGCSIAHQGRHEEAEVLFREIVAGRQRMVGEARQGTFDAFYWLGSSLYDQNRFSEAEAVLREVVTMRRATKADPDNDNLLLSLRLAEFIREQDRLSEAEAMLQELVEDAVVRLGNEHEYTLRARNALEITQSSIAEQTQEAPSDDHVEIEGEQENETPLQEHLDPAGAELFSTSLVTTGVGSSVASPSISSTATPESKQPPPRKGLRASLLSRLRRGVRTPKE